MPQLDVTTYASQLFWLLVTFVPFYLIVYKIALPRISDVLEARQDKIDDDLKKAAARKEEAEAVMAEYEKLQAESRAKAQEAIRLVQEEMKAESQRSGEELSRKLAAEAAEAEQRVQAAKDQALAQLGDTVAEVVTSATAKLIGEKPGDDQVARAVRAAAGGQS